MMKSEIKNLKNELNIKKNEIADKYPDYENERIVN